MGLIERLHGPADPDSMFARAFALREQPNVDQDPAEEPRPQPEQLSVDPGAAVRALLKELQVRKEYGITSPSHLFSLLHRHLQVDRGALLVPAPESEYLPVATAGLDRTSTLRLRLSNDDVASLMDGRRVVILSGSQRNLFAPRLSGGDFRRAPRIASLPFFHLNRLLAVLLVFGSPILELDTSVLDVILGALSDGAGRMLFDGRHKPLGHRVRSVVLRPEQLPGAVARLLGSVADSESVDAFRVDIGDLVNLIMSVHPHLDRDRLVEDMIDTTALLVSDSHVVVPDGTAGLLVVGRMPATLDNELLVHLISKTLSGLFGLPRPFVLEYQNQAVDELTRDA